MICNKLLLLFTEIPNELFCLLFVTDLSYYILEKNLNSKKKIKIRTFHQIWEVRYKY